MALYSGGRVNRWEDKAVFAPLFEYDSLATPAVPATAAIQRADMIDLTAKLDKEGNLQWDVPAGHWTILRMGYSLTGAKNNPAVPASQSFEVDKLSRKHVAAYYHGYTDPIARVLGPEHHLGGTGATVCEFRLSAFVLRRVFPG